MLWDETLSISMPKLGVELKELKQLKSWLLEYVDATIATEIISMDIVMIYILIGIYLIKELWVLDFAYCFHMCWIKIGLVCRLVMKVRLCWLIIRNVKLWEYVRYKLICLIRMWRLWLKWEMCLNFGKKWFC